MKKKKKIFLVVVVVQFPISQKAIFRLANVYILSILKLKLTFLNNSLLENKYI